MSWLDKIFKRALDLGAPDDPAMDPAGIDPAAAPAAPTEEAVHHCPFCGSKNVTGGSDGTVECGFCSKVVKVYIEPTHPSMPLTVDGQPYQAPGTSEVTGEPVPAANGPAVDPALATPPGAAPAAPGGIERFRADAGAPMAGAPAAAGGGIERYRTAIFRTATGAQLPLDDFLSHLAIEHADDRQAVLMQVQASRG